MEQPSRRALRRSNHVTPPVHGDERRHGSFRDDIDNVSVASTLEHDPLDRVTPGPGNITNMNQYNTVGQLAFEAATRTTVVTTTTTTTTSFPPIILQQQKQLWDKDSKQFPLANSPTPSTLRHFNMTVHGHPAQFSETGSADGNVKLSDRSQLIPQLLDSTSRRIMDGQQPFGTPQTAPKKNAPPLLSLDVATASSETRKHKRQDTSPLAPPSIAEAAEIASLQRRNKRHKSSIMTSTSSRPPLGKQLSKGTAVNQEIHLSGPATPETEMGSFMAPPGNYRGRRPSLRSSKNVSASSLDGEAHWPSTHNHPIQMHPLATTSANYETPAPVGIAATPPIIEGDLDRVVSFEASVERQIPPRGSQVPSLEALDDIDDSLPSPSLSPITAAAQFEGPTSVQGADDENNEVSSLDISEEMAERRLRLIHQRQPSTTDVLESHDGRIALPPNTQLGLPGVMDTPSILESFEVMPSEMQQYVMYQLLRRCNKRALQFVAGVVNPALCCDFLDLLPLELSLNITKHLDVRSLCRAAQVSHKWRRIVDSDESTWKDLLHNDGYELQDGELERAIREGWGWQFPYDRHAGEMDLRSLVTKPPTGSRNVSSSRQMEQHLLYGNLAIDITAEVDQCLTPTGRPKRKAAGKLPTSGKRARRTAPSVRPQLVAFLAMPTLTGPNAHAAQARFAVPEPAIGVPKLRNMHLYKSLYRRHFLIRRSWMDSDTSPQHIAFRAHQRHVVTCLQFDTDKILTGSDDTKINVYDTKTGAKRKTLEGHDGGVWALEYEGNTLVSGSTDRSVRVWNIETGKCSQVFQGHTSTVRCLVILKPAQIGVNEQGEPIMMPKIPLIITGSRDSSLRVWKLPSLDDPSFIQAGPSASDYDNPYFLRVLTGHHHSVRAIAAYGDLLVSGSYDCTVRVWKISSGEMQHRLLGHTSKVYSVVLDHNRKRCISGSMDNMVKVWSLERGDCIFNLEGHTSLVGLLDLSHERLVSAAADSTLRVWDPQNGHCKATLKAHTGAITCFQHDDQKVISGSDKALKMWNIKTGACVSDLLTDLTGVWQVRFNERRCVAAVQRKNATFIEVLDFGANRDCVPPENRGRRIVVDESGNEELGMTELVENEEQAPVEVTEEP